MIEFYCRLPRINLLLIKSAKKKTVFYYGFLPLIGLLIERTAARVVAKVLCKAQKPGGKDKSLSSRTRILAIGLALIIAIPSAHAAEPRYDVDIPSMNVAGALNRLAEQTGEVMIFPYDLAVDRQSNAVVGQYTLMRALEKLLEGSGLSGGLTDKRVVQISVDQEEGPSQEKEDTAVKKRGFIASLIVALTGPAIVDVHAQTQETALEEIVVTAQKRSQNIQDVPISISVLSGQKLNSKFTGGEDILAVASSAPGLYAESSNGRVAPRFYMRGLGNADFDSAASQPVSVVFDEVPMENVFLKSFPVFDIDRIEVIRGPQGTLFGRNTTAGIVKLDSRRPTEETEGYARFSAGEMGTFNAEAALGGTLIDDTLTARVSLLTQNRSDYIDNGFTGENDAIGGYNEYAGRLQLLWTPTDTFSALLLHQRRDHSGNSSTPFRANVFTAGSNELNGNYDRNTVYHDGGANNMVSTEANGTTLKLDWDIGNYTVSSITSYQRLDQGGRGDIDGGVVDPTFTATVPDGITSDTPFFTIPCFCPALTFPGNIFISSDGRGAGEFNQLTQEIRIASNFDGAFNYQTGAFYFDDEQSFASQIGIGPNPEDIFTTAIALQTNTAWAIFVQGDYDISERLTTTVGVRYSDDEKDYTDVSPFPTQPTAVLGDSSVSWNVSLAYDISDTSQTYARIASGFRAPSIQAGNVGFGGPITTATSETIMSYEVGYKADYRGRIRLNAAVFFYDIDDMQLTAIGGNTETTTLLNADGGQGYGVEFDIDYLVSENLILSGGFGYNKTEIKDGTLAVAPCQQCTITNPFDETGNALIDGNPFQHAPEWTLNVELDYRRPLSNDNELFFYTDWKVKGPTNDFLHKSLEYNFDSQFEGGLRAGYRNNSKGFELAIFARNITDEDNPIGGIDFTNNTGYVNQPRVWGIEAGYSF